MAVMCALTDGGYSDDAELAFIQCLLQDARLQALLRVSHAVYRVSKAKWLGEK